MRHRVLATLALPVVAACSDTTGPEGPTTEVSLNLCGGLPYSWVAVHNRGVGWKQVSPSSAGTLIFDATEQVSIAFVLDFFGSTLTQVINTTPAELNAGNAGSALGCEGFFGDRLIRGAVSGVSGNEIVDIYAAWSATYASAEFPDFELTDLPNSGTIDVIALRAPDPASRPDRAVTRRGIIPNSDGLPISTIDFAVEGVALEQHTLTLQNVGTGDEALVQSALLTSNGTVAPMGEVQASGGGTMSFVSIPASLRVATDMHALSAIARNIEGERELEHYYKTPSNLTLALRSMVATPTFAPLGTSPYLRVRATLPSQSDYPSGALMQFYQETGDISFKLVAVLTTAAYHGGTPPSAWTLEIPDFGDSGYQPAWGLGGSSYEWIATAYGGDPAAATERRPADGSTMYASTRFSGSTGASVRSRASVGARALGYRLTSPPGSPRRNRSSRSAPSR